MRLLEQTWSGIPGTIYTRPHILFYSSGLSLSSCDLPPFPVFANVLNSSSSPPCLPYSLLLWTALFGSMFGLWRPRGSHAVFSSQSAVFPSPMPRPCYTQHTHKHTLSITLLYSLSACPSLSTSSLSASFPSCPSPPFSAPTPICFPAKCNVCQRHRVDTHTKRKRRKKCVQAHHLYFISSFSLHPLLWLFALNLLARNEKASEIVAEKKVTITWTRWHAVVKTRNTLLWHKQNRTNFNL